MGASSGRFGRVLEAAREQAAGAGENDLRRLKRQFSSLKNTFMLYDTKEHFIDGEQLMPSPAAMHTTGALQACAAHAGLLDDMPDGSEMRKLQDLEEHVGAQGATVKKIKQQNAKASSQPTSFPGVATGQHLQSGGRERSLTGLRMHHRSRRR